MSFCANLDCPHRRRVGRPPEYADGVTECTECGERLTEGRPPAPPEPPNLPWPKPLRQRLLITGGAVAALWLMLLVPSPFLDLEVAAAIANGSWISTSLLLGPFALSIWPIVSGFILVELVTLAVPRWSHRRHGDPAFRGQMNKIAIVLGMVLAFAQGYMGAVVVSSQSLAYGFDIGMVPHPGMAFNLSFALTQAAGTGVITILAITVSRAGLGNGFAVVLLADTLFSQPFEARETHRLITTNALQPEMVMLYFTGLAVFAAGLWWVLTRPIRRTRSGLPIPMPSCGTWPLELTVILLLVPMQIGALLGNDWSKVTAGVFLPGNPYTLFLDIGVVLIMAPLAAWLFFWRYRSSLARAENAMDWFGARLRDTGLLVAILVGWHMLHRVGGENNGIGLTVLVLFLALAILADLWEEVQARRRAPFGADLVVLASYQHPVDAVLDLDQRPPEVGAMIQHLHYRSLTYFLGPFVPVQVLGVTERPLKVEWTSGADEELDAIVDQLEADNARTAQRLMERILNATKGLVAPLSELTTPEQPSEPRTMRVPQTPFLILYLVRGDTAEVVHVVRDEN
jgi:plasmid stabilization system protein ParE